MPVLAYCTLKRFDVLPSEPLDFRFSNIGTNIGLLHWERPDKHSESVTGYQVTWKKMYPFVGELATAETSHMTFIFENLEPDSSYEVR